MEQSEHKDSKCGIPGQSGNMSALTLRNKVRKNVCDSYRREPSSFVIVEIVRSDIDRNVLNDLVLIMEPYGPYDLQKITTDLWLMEVEDID